MTEEQNNITQYRVSGGDLIIKIIPDTVLNYLPMTPEPLAQWNDATDLRHLLGALYDFSPEVLTPDGIKASGSMKWWGYELYDMSRESFNSWIQKFSANVKEAVSSKSGTPTSISFDFLNDPFFGQAAKYLIAWERLINRTLEDSVYFSIAHVLESEDDLKCSFDLAANFYYKQSLQILRNFLEDLVLPIQFCDTPQEYTNWKADNYRVPPLRGRDGLLKKMVDRNLLPSSLADTVSTLYGNLNGFVHGSEKRLINKGQYSRTWAGHVFKPDDFNEWCKFVSQAVAAGIHLLKINLEQWETIRSQRRVICSTCHNDKDFDISKHTFGGEEFTNYRCLKCGGGMTLNSAFGKSFTVTFSEQS
jgi:hypothetical protein